MKQLIWTLALAVSFQFVLAPEAFSANDFGITPTAAGKLKQNGGEWVFERDSSGSNYGTARNLRTGEVISRTLLVTGHDSSGYREYYVDTSRSRHQGGKVSRSVVGAVAIGAIGVTAAGAAAKRNRDLVEISKTDDGPPPLAVDGASDASSATGSSSENPFIRSQQSRSRSQTAK